MDQLIIDLMRQVDNLQTKFDGQVKPEIRKVIIDRYLALPGLVGFWPMSSVQRSTGNAYDLSAQGRTLTYNGNPTYNIYNNLTPYIDLDGTGDFLSRADEADLDILGTETVYAAAVRGVTLGGWFRFDRLLTAEYLISKFTTGNDLAYALNKQADDTIRVIVSDGAGDFDSAASTDTVTTGQWYFCVGRWIPGITADVWLQGETDSGVASVNALTNSGAGFAIGCRRPSAALTLLDGQATLCFLCANALPDSLINSLYQQTRVLFGV